MSVGVAAAVANAWVNVLRGTTYTGLAGLFVKLHVGDPGPAGAANPSAVTTRNALTLAAPANGAGSLSALAGYAMVATETITHVSLWDAAAGGAFLGSGPLSAPKPVNNGDTLTFNSFVVAVGPVAA